MKSNTDLKRCPFCGGEAKIDKTTSNAVEVACSECSASTPLFWAFIGGEEKAIEAWNTRKPMERIMERLEWLRKRNIELSEKTDWSSVYIHKADS